MTAKTNFLENQLIDHVLRNTVYPSPTTVYLALFTAAPGEAGGGTEVSAGGYARQPVTFDAPTDGLSSNSAVITFGPATASWATITDFAIFDAVSGGNMLYYGAFSSSKPIDTDDIYEVIAGNLSVAEL